MRSLVLAVTFLVAGCGATLFGLASTDARRNYLAEHHPEWLAAAEAPCQQVGYTYRGGLFRDAGAYRAQPGEKIDEYRCVNEYSVERDSGLTFLKGWINSGMSKKDVDALWGEGVFRHVVGRNRAYSYPPWQHGDVMSGHVVVLYEGDGEIADWYYGDSRFRRR